MQGRSLPPLQEQQEQPPPHPQQQQPRVHQKLLV